MPLAHAAGGNTRLEQILVLSQEFTRCLVDDLEFGGIPEWDSLTHVDLMLALEAEFGVTIDEEKMIELTSVRAIRLFIPEPK